MPSKLDTSIKFDTHRQNGLNISFSSNKALWQEGKVRTTHFNEVSQGDDTEHESQLKPLDDIYEMRRKTTTQK